MQTLEIGSVKIERKCVAIVLFGPATPTSGMRAGEYFQVTIDPEHVSPSGEYIRFGIHPGDEIHGWQRIDALTVAEVLAYWEGDDPPNVAKYAGAVTLKAISA